jgi:hypothetical protein
VLTIVPNHKESETVLVLRLKGQRTAYTIALSDIYRMAALWHGLKESKAKRYARKIGVPWREYRREWLNGLVPPKTVRQRNTKREGTDRDNG